VAQADPQSQAYIPLTLKGSSEQARPAASSKARACLAAPATGTPANAPRAPLWKYYKSDGTRHPTHSRENWVQGTILNYSSGFTGTVGFAVEAAGYNAIALQQSREAVAGPNNRTLTHSDGDPIGQWSKWAWATSRRGCPTPP
jgi:hypothetical protein